MCLILLALDRVPQRPWLLLGNRDEFHARPTAAAAAWNGDPDVVGGRDLQAGGSWLAVNRNGRFAAVTNVRSGIPARGPRSRGDLVADFVRGGDAAASYAKSISSRREEYGPFNLIVSDGIAVWGVSSVKHDPWRFEPGIHTLSNGAPEVHWPKTQRLQAAFEASLKSGKATDAALLDLLGDTFQPLDADLPHTGVGLDLERLLAPVFIRGGHYGTRASTLAYARTDGTIVLDERRFGPAGMADGETSIEI
ncbi:MAG: NRDE family protein [Rudaea sp.]|nr:NRDE family protein [Rudaea sp.]